MRERSSNPFNKLYHRMEHLYATGVKSRQIYTNRYIPDEVVGLGLASLSDDVEKEHTRPMVKLPKKEKQKTQKASVSSDICV